MPRYRITVEYDGTDYVGWQRQKDGPSVQQTIEEAIYEYAQEEVRVFCAGRTDTGVHALGQVAHFDIAAERTPYSVREGLNQKLSPARIAILDVEEVSEDFHARFSAIGRKYIYRIVHRPARLALDYNRAWHVYGDLDTDAMQDAASILIGTHDFTSFRSTQCQADSPVKTLDRLDIVRNGEEIAIYVEALSFLHHQVRNMVGTLAHVGKGKWSKADVQHALDAKDRKAGGLKAPAHGLYLSEVVYPSDTPK